MWTPERRGPPPLTPPWALPTLLLALVAHTAAAAETAGTPLTYPWRDAETQEWLVCNQCPPGTFVQQPCRRDTPTMCGACPPRHYTQFWNYLERCRYCNVICGEREEEARPCEATHNRACRCRPGFFAHAGFCLEHTPCPPGTGVAVPGGHRGLQWAAAVRAGSRAGGSWPGTSATTEDSTPGAPDLPPHLIPRHPEPEHAVPAMSPWHFLSQQLQLREVPAPPQLHGPGPQPQRARLLLPRCPVHQLHWLPAQHYGARRAR